MTTTSAEGPARAPTPRPKGPPKAPPSDNPRSSQPSPGGKGGESGAGVGAGAGARAGAGVGVGAGRRGARTGPPDPLSDKATAFLVRRTLCPQHLEKGKSTPVSIDELLPPLTSRNDVDLQLYALIAIILREFVQNWYNKITPDEAFVAEIVQTIAHITRALEQRLRKVDLESLLFDELPDLLDKHITAYRAAHDPVVHHPLQANPQEIYHSLHPLPALTPIPCLGNAASIAEQAENEVAYRQLLVHGVLAVLLPTEDLENECLTALVGQIFSELIIGNAVANKLSEPWLIYEVLCIASRVLLQRRAAGNEGAPGKLSSKGSSDARSVFSVQALFWTILQWCFLATSFIRTIFTILIASRSVPPRSSRSSLNHDDVTDQKVGFAEHSPLGDSSETGEAGPEPLKTPVLAFRCWAAISNLIEMDVRMPWLRGTLSLLQWIAMAGPGRIADVDGKLDRLLSYGIHRYLLDPANLPPLLRNVRGALFPNNMPGTPTLVAPSSEAELLALRRKCARALWALVPGKGPRGGAGGAIGRLYLKGSLFTAATATTTTTPLPHKISGGGRALGSGYGVSSPGSASSSPTASARALSREAKRSAAQQRKHGQGQGTAGHDSEEGSRSAPRSGGGGGGSTIAGTGGGQPSGSSSSAASYPPGPGLAAAGLTDSSVQKATAALMTQRTGAAKGFTHGHDTRATTPVPHTDSVTDHGEDVDGDDEEVLAEIERGILDVFSDAYCNKHLVYAVVELVLIRLLPEMAEKGVVELWAERIA